MSRKRELSGELRAKQKSAKKQKTNDQHPHETKDSEIDPLDAFMVDLSSTMTDAEKRALQGLEDPLHEESKSDKFHRNTDRFFGDEESLGEEEIKLSEELSWQDKQKRAQPKELKPINHSKINYMPFRKDFYFESPEISKMSEEQVKALRDQMEGVKLHGVNVPKPITKWAHCGLPGKIYDIIERAKFAAPFPIQAQAIPVIMSGRDCLGCAKTGSGKTLAYVLPMLRHILDQPDLSSGDGPIGLILAPTRELVTQIYDDCKTFGKPVGLTTVPIYGGADVGQQISALKRGAHVVVGTPGRLIDVLMLNQGRVLSLTRVTYLVVDEADRMFDLGFEPQIMKIIQNTRPDKQTVLFSATFPKAVEGLAKKALVNKPVEIVVGGRLTASTSVSQIVEVRSPASKFARLLEILGVWYSKGNILIFADSHESVDHLFSKLHDAGYGALILHGGMDQTDREGTLRDFKSKVRTLMVATSVLARGLDVKDLVLVINYDTPQNTPEYIHRVGRTGRAGNTGTAITFVAPDDLREAGYLVKTLADAKQVVPKDLARMADEYKDKVRKGELKHYDDSRGGRGYTHSGQENAAWADAHALSRTSTLASATGDAVFIDELKERAALAESDKKSKDKDKDKETDLVTRLIEQAKLAAHAMGTGSSAAAKMAAVISLKQKLIESSLQQQHQQQAAQASPSTTSTTTAVGTLGQDYFVSEIEINDYPQHARWKATHKPSLEVILENLADVTITTKGTFIALGKKLEKGQRKLYLLIEAKDKHNCSIARAELLRLLDEAA